jgi:transposase-like protein
MQVYSNQFKQEMVRKLTMPGAPSALAMSREVGVSSASLSKWVREYGKKVSLGKTRVERTPRSWTAEEKLKAVTETSGMEEKELGEYLRREGLHSFHLEQWRQEAVGALDKPKRTQKEISEIAKLKREKKALERELRRKEKALAEASYLLFVQKKAQEMWGDKEDS